jgi:tripartite-type tricarboxylate transporter receptor subunit TctC
VRHRPHVARAWAAKREYYMDGPFALFVAGEIPVTGVGFSQGNDRGRRWLAWQGPADGAVLIVIRRHFIAGASALAVSSALPRYAWAQAWPAKPIRLIVPFPPGGGTDVVSRLVAEKLGPALNTAVIVDNRPGAGGNIGIDAAAKSPPDGYTIAMGQTSNLAINPTLYGKLTFNPLRDFTPVVLVASQPMVLIVVNEAPWKTLAELVATAKAKPGTLTMASAGNGTVGHLAGEMFARQAGIEFVHVPYKGASPALTDLMGGQVSLFFASAGAIAPQLAAGGKVRGLAVTSAKRLPKLPNIPTIAESGYAGFEATDWKGLVAPVGTPAAVVSRLNAEVGKILQSPDALDRLATEGSEPIGGSPEYFAGFLKAQDAKWSRIVKESGAKVD